MMIATDTRIARRLDRLETFDQPRLEVPKQCRPRKRLADGDLERQSLRRFSANHDARAPGRTARACVPAPSDSRTARHRRGSRDGTAPAMRHRWSHKHAHLHARTDPPNDVEG